MFEPAVRILVFATRCPHHAIHRHELRHDELSHNSRPLSLRRMVGPGIETAEMMHEVTRNPGRRWATADRQLHCKGAAVSGPACNLDRRAVSIGDPLDETESETRPIVYPRSRRIHTVEAFEYVWQCVCRDTDARVAHSESGSAAFACHRDGDHPAGGVNLIALSTRFSSEPLHPSAIADDFDLVRSTRTLV